LTDADHEADYTGLTEICDLTSINELVRMFGQHHIVPLYETMLSITVPLYITLIVIINT